ncbi:MAG TPA: hypothetical protein PLH72_00080 [Vicinamibacterales bacterium]|nr:hypothetical protein [Vicinamibacterales bacterium]
MAADLSLIALIDQLVALFNRQSLDLPDGLFDRHSHLRLNGTPFEHMLGRPPGDPLVLLMTRGPAGYRFAVKALQHAVPDAHVERGEVEPGPDTGEAAWTVPLWLSGHLRSIGEPVDAVLRVRVVVSPGGSLAQADVAIDDAPLRRLREARLRE